MTGRMLRDADMILVSGTRWLLPWRNAKHEQRRLRIGLCGDEDGNFLREHCIARIQLHHCIR